MSGECEKVLLASAWTCGGQGCGDSRTHVLAGFDGQHGVNFLLAHYIYNPVFSMPSDVHAT